MGFFTKKSELLKCPVCKKSTFEKVDYFYIRIINGQYQTTGGQYKAFDGQTTLNSRGETIGRQNCENFVGENTGCCPNCGEDL